MNISFTKTISTPPKSVSIWKFYTNQANFNSVLTSSEFCRSSVSSIQEVHKFEDENDDMEPDTGPNDYNISNDENGLYANMDKSASEDAAELDRSDAKPAGLKLVLPSSMPVSEV